MLKHTPRKWDWINVAGKDGLLKTIIVVKQENDGGLFDCNEEPLKPTIGDLQLTTNAPEMHEMLHETIDELDVAYAEEKITQDIYYKMRRKISALLAEIDVERDKTR